MFKILIAYNGNNPSDDVYLRDMAKIPEINDTIYFSTDNNIITNKALVVSVILNAFGEGKDGVISPEIHGHAKIIIEKIPFTDK